MTRQSSKTLVPETFTGSIDFENYATHIELMSHLQKWQCKETVNGAQTEIDELPQCIVLGLRRLAVDFYRKLLEDTRKSF